MTAPTFVAANAAEVSFASSITLSLDAGAAANRCVVCFSEPATDPTTQPNSATYGGVSMTAGTLFTDTSKSRKARAFWLYGGSVPTGTNNLIVTYSDGNGKPAIVGVSYSGVDSAAGVSGEVTNFGSSTNATWTVSSATGDLVVACFIFGNGVSGTPQGAAVERYDASTGANYSAYAMESAGGASVTINSTLNFTDFWAGAAVSLKAVAAVAINPHTNYQLGPLLAQ